jgi:hypothetical protein
MVVQDLSHHISFVSIRELGIQIYEMKLTKFTHLTKCCVFGEIIGNHIRVQPPTHAHLLTRLNIRIAVLVVNVLVVLVDVVVALLVVVVVIGVIVLFGARAVFHARTPMSENDGQDVDFDPQGVQDRVKHQVCTLETTWKQERCVFRDVGISMRAKCPENPACLG